MGSKLTSLALIFIATIFSAFAIGQLPPTPEAPRSTAESPKRLKRDSRFSDKHRVFPKLDDLKPGEGIGGSGYARARVSPIPVREADAIVLGQVSTIESRFTADHTAIYTEFQFVPERVLKGAQEGSYELVMFGGAIKKADGRVIRFRDDDPLMPKMSRRYVLFMKRDAATESYSPIRIWELANGHPALVSASPEDKKAIADGSLITDMSESTFLSAIEHAITTAAAEQQQ